MTSAHHIRHTLQAEPTHDITAATAAFGEELLDRGLPPRTVISLARIAGSMLAEDHKQRAQRAGQIDEHYSGIHGSIQRLFGGAMNDDAELGHVIAMGGTNTIDSAADRLQGGLHEALTILAENEGVRAVTDNLPQERTKLSVLHDKRSASVTFGLAALKAPSADVYSADTRDLVTIHQRSMIGVADVDTEGKVRTLSVDEVRAILAQHQDEVYDERLAVQDGNIFVIPLSVALIGLRKTLR
ncbi:MAG TPA: hypothetical protein VL362_02760 [Patescibacteria group bacterium]|jgi:hypothetical protein|nr:hypothetical protein [Patescibacteria group bacterium]